MAGAAAGRAQTRLDRAAVQKYEQLNQASKLSGVHRRKMVQSHLFSNLVLAPVSDGWGIIWNKKGALNQETGTSSENIMKENKKIIIYIGQQRKLIACGRPFFGKI